MPKLNPKKHPNSNKNKIMLNLISQLTGLHPLAVLFFLILGLIGLGEMARNLNKKSK
jgi:hypothetical protein